MNLKFDWFDVKVNTAPGNEDFFRNIVETLDEGVLLLDGKGVIIFANPAAEMLLGCKQEALLGTHCPRLIHPMDEEATKKCPLCTARTSKIPFYSREVIFCRSDGTSVPVSIRATPVNREGGGLLVAFYNISAEKAAVEKLADSERKLHVLINATPGTAILLDVDGRIETINSIGARRLAGTPEELVGRDIFTLFPAELSAQRHAMFSCVCASGEPARKLDQRGQFFFETVMFPVANKKGETQRVAVYADDVTENRREEFVRSLFQEIGDLLLRRKISLDTLLWHFCRGVAPIFDFAFVWIAHKQPDGRIEITAGAESTEGLLSRMKELDLRWDAVSTDPVCGVLRHGTLQMAETGLSDHSDCRLLAFENGANHIVCIPLALEGGIYDVLTLGIKDSLAPDMVTLKRLEDIGSRLSMTMEAAIQQERLNLMETALETNGNAAFITDAAGAILWANTSFGRLTGYAPEEAIGQNPKILKSGAHEPSFHAAMWKTILAGNVWQGEVIEARRDGSHFTVHQTITPLRDPEGRISHFVSIFEDISAQKAAQEQIAHLANYDTLTDLPNRRLFFDLLGQTLALANRTGNSCALMFLDLDHFKEVNDQRGHEVGDQVLKAVTERLRGLVRESDTVARLGGDEFTVILSAVGGREDCARVAEKIVATIGQPYKIADREEKIGVSIGIALSLHDGADSESLVRAADKAMYAAKAAGRSSVRFAAEHSLQHVSTLTCPQCGHAKQETMPDNACQWFYECEGCHALLKPKQGDCCVFCSYGDVPCPPVQESGYCCTRSGRDAAN